MPSFSLANHFLFFFFFITSSTTFPSIEHQQPSHSSIKLHQYCTTVFTPPSPQAVSRLISKMFTKTIIVCVLAAFAAAIPPTHSPTTLIGISTHIGNDYVHLREINASGQRFYLNKATSTFCPKGSPKIDCSKCKFSLRLSCPLVLLILMFSRWQRNRLRKQRLWHPLHVYCCARWPASLRCLRWCFGLHRRTLR